jgi:3-hydroxyisobutyrate dehydrogenase-like beta-hydroxyacid dehydrogenase
MRIGVVHPGAMGAAVAGALVRAGHEVSWASDGRSAETAERAAANGLRDAGSVGALAERVEVVLSICPPHAAVEVAAAFAGFRGVYVDANAVAPATAQALSERVERFVDGGIVGPPPTAPGTTRLFLSGPEAGSIAALFEGSDVEAQVVSSASAVKVAYAAWTKGSAALLLTAAAFARAQGVEEELFAEAARSQPELAAQLEAAERSAAEKGWRWVAEMEEIAAAFADVGLPDGFHRAAADVYRGFTRD